MAREPSVYEERIENVRKELKRQGGKALILPPGDDQFYLAGNPELQIQPRHTFFVLPSDGDPFLFMSSNNERNIRELTPIEDIVIWDDDDDPVEALMDALSSLGLTSEDTVFIDEQMWALFVDDLHKILDAEIELADDIVMQQRIQKDQYEIDAIERACEIVDEVSEEIRGLDAVGMTENELVAEIQYRMQEKGGDSGLASFPVAVASGPNGAKPSYYPARDLGRREIRPNEPVVLDFGASVNGYLSDQARVVVYEGEPPEPFKEAYEVVLEAQQAAVEAIEPGVVASEIDEVARSIIEDAGYGEQFLHVTGHGVGLGVHEPPFLMSGQYIGEGNAIELQPGMVVTVEPAIYSDDWGIRIEDDVLVEEGGSRRLTDSDHGWKSLD
ncbi:M24 family metallopeptidase [Halorubrum trueperi]|uniref:M24 family metallopeptidase n=1 Tax=Halorubrum trueperi TaxID=2004704 RepID=A0ABD5UHG7_9EURY